MLAYTIVLALGIVLGTIIAVGWLLFMLVLSVTPRGRTHIRQVVWPRITGKAAVQPATPITTPDPKFTASPGQRSVQPRPTPSPATESTRPALEQGDLPGAQTAYRRAIKTGDATGALPAAMHLAKQLRDQGDLAGARAAYQRAIDSGDATWAPLAAIHLGDLLREHGDLAGARACYQRAIDSGHAYCAPRAAHDLDGLMLEQGEQARQAFERGH